MNEMMSIHLHSLKKNTFSKIIWILCLHCYHTVG